MSHDPPTADLQKKSSCSDNQLELPTRSLSVHHRMWNLITVAISESGGRWDVAPSSDVQKLGANHAASLNCGVTNVCNQCRIDRKEMSGLPLTKISCLRSKTTVGLNATEPGFPGTIIYSGINPNSFQPCIDGKTIPAQPSRVGTKFLLSLSQVSLLIGMKWNIWLSIIRYCWRRIYILGQFGTTSEILTGAIAPPFYKTALEIGSTTPLTPCLLSAKVSPGYSQPWTRSLPMFRISVPSIEPST
jgi:hypothetical protein